MNFEFQAKSARLLFATFDHHMTKMYIRLHTIFINIFRYCMSLPRAASCNRVSPYKLIFLSFSCLILSSILQRVASAEKILFCKVPTKQFSTIYIDTSINIQLLHRFSLKPLLYKHRVRVSEYILTESHCLLTFVPHYCVVCLYFALFNCLVWQLGRVMLPTPPHPALCSLLENMSSSDLSLLCPAISVLAFS